MGSLIPKSKFKTVAQSFQILMLLYSLTNLLHLYLMYFHNSPLICIQIGAGSTTNY